MILYHGSNIEVSEIDLSKSKSGLDFGRGFYTTSIREQAEIWAERRRELHGGKAIVSEFEFIWENVFLNPEYKTVRFEGYTDEWLDFVVANRRNKSNVQAHDYDVVEGPLADDDVVVRVRNFENNEISREALLEELKFKKVTHQICFCTTKSLDSVERINLKPLSKIENIGISVINRLVSNDNFTVIAAHGLYHTSKTFEKVSDESTGLYKKTGREIYEMLKLEKKKQQ